MLTSLLEKLLQESLFTESIGAQVPSSKFIGIALHGFSESDNTAKILLEIPSYFFSCSKLTKCVWAWWFRSRFAYRNTSTSISLLLAQSTVSVPSVPPAVLWTLLCCQKKKKKRHIGAWRSRERPQLRSSTVHERGATMMLPLCQQHVLVVVVYKDNNDAT